MVALPAADPLDAARIAGLRYLNDDTPGLRRRKAGSGFTYVDDKGAAVRDKATLGRIKALAIPPAWTDVWICPVANGHIQATGRDARGRKQYRYHARWRSVRDETKYHRSIAFARALPKIRARVTADLRRDGLPREKVLACVVQLLERSAIRVGNEEYARQNGSIGLTTMKDRHVEIRGPKIHFRFKGKSGKPHAIELEDRRLARIVKNCRDIPGQDLFQYEDEEGNYQSIGSADVNDYLRSIAGDDFTAKDFRTWLGTVQAAVQLAAAEEVTSASAAKKTIVAAIGRVAERLGNTVAVCRKSYVHPAVIDAYLRGGLGVVPSGERAAEKAVLRVLRKATRSPFASAPSRASRPRR